jgi:F-type H+-transporting ATPase subunit epsilon
MEQATDGSLFSCHPFLLEADYQGVMLSQLHVELVAADRKVWSGEARILIARTTEGELGILPGHVPVLGVLESGLVTIRTTDGETVVAAVHGGFLSVADNNVSILAEVAELAEEIDVAEAEELLSRVQAGESDQDAEAQRRAETRLRAAGGLR